MWRNGCLALLGIAAILIVAGIAVVVVAVVQNGRVETVEERLEIPLGPEPTASIASMRVEIDLQVGEAIVLPGPADGGLTIDALFDPDEYRLDQSVEERDGQFLHRIALTPRGNRSWAILRAKIGRKLPLVRIQLPRDQALDFEMALRGSFATAELGGLDLGEAAFDVDASGLQLSFIEPTVQPLEQLTIVGDKGAIELTGLGYASPEESRIQQHLGGIDLDLRGPWRADGRLAIDMKLTGGSLWLPDGVDLIGAEGY